MLRPDAAPNNLTAFTFLSYLMEVCDW